MTVNSMDERVSTGMTPLVRIDTGMEGREGGESETMVGGTGVLSLVWWRTWRIRLALGLIMGMSLLPCIVLIAMSIEVAERRCSPGGVERSDKLGGLPSWVSVRVCKRGITGVGERGDKSGQFAALHSG